MGKVACLGWTVEAAARVGVCSCRSLIGLYGADTVSQGVMVTVCSYCSTPAVVLF